MTPGLATSRRAPIVFFAAIFAFLAAARLCHWDVLWSDEDYHLAAAIQILHAKVPYRDFWYDKPPLNAILDALFGARTGWILRIVSALFAAGVSALAFQFAQAVWSRREGYAAAGLMAFFLIFYFPGATITLEPDTWMLAPHLIAIYLAWRGRAFASGIVAGVAMLINVKALYLLAACTLFLNLNAFPMLALGFAIPCAAAAGCLMAAGAWSGYVQQVWRWGLLYATLPLSGESHWTRVANWAGFHAALVIPAIWCWKEASPVRAKLILWTVISLLAAAVGGRFAPRYIDQLLPPLAIAAARGTVLIMAGSLAFDPWRRWKQALLGLLLAIPLLRFAPAYAQLAWEDLAGKPHRSTDLAMDLDSRAAAGILSSLAHPGDTILVWGYRPDVIAFTRLPIGSRFLDSQPLTGVPADRHLSSSRPIDAKLGAANRAELAHARYQPTLLVDGLSLYNPDLDIHKYPDLADWLSRYCEVARTRGTIIYRKCGAR